MREQWTHFLHLDGVFQKGESLLENYWNEMSERHIGFWRSNLQQNLTRWHSSSDVKDVIMFFEYWLWDLAMKWFNQFSQFIKHFLFQQIDRSHTHFFQFATVFANPSTEFTSCSNIKTDLGLSLLFQVAFLLKRYSSYPGIVVWLHCSLKALLRASLPWPLLYSGLFHRNDQKFVLRFQLLLPHTG